MPALGYHLWSDFSDMAQDHRYSEAGIMALTSLDIQAWCTLNRVSLSSWELKIIREMSRIYVKSQRQK